jgi:hypothetical protein
MMTQRRKKKRKTSTTSTSIKQYFSDEARLSKEKPSVFSNILMDNSIVERWDDEKKEFDTICAHLKSYFNSSAPPDFDCDKAIERRTLLMQKIKCKSELYTSVNLALQRSREHVKVLLRPGFASIEQEKLYESVQWKKLGDHCSKRLKLFLDDEDLEEKSEMSAETVQTPKRTMEGSLDHRVTLHRTIAEDLAEIHATPFEGSFKFISEFLDANQARSRNQSDIG